MGGVLAAAMVVPIVATTGVLVRNEANKFTTLSLTTQALPQRSEILDRYGHLLAYVYGVDVCIYNSSSNATALQYFGWDRQPVELQPDRPEHGQRHRGHRGLQVLGTRGARPAGTIRAAVNDIQHQPVQGGSTIAQQYVKNVLLLSAEMAGSTQAAKAAYADHPCSRKLNELRLAVGAEHNDTKQGILLVT